LLLRPAEPEVLQGRRLLISPDGPLHSLPFAALRRGSLFLAELRPTHLVQSGSIYAMLRATGAPHSSTFVAFGDPAYASGGSAALPASRGEVTAIARLFPRATLHLGAEASEERAKSIGRNARYVHFACHGTINERFPLESALLLAADTHGGENGSLHAWEILEHLRLDADLVTLSACRSSGTPFAGEGLIGLTRAFQYAGARSVLASLWAIGDRANLALMTDFYRALRSGASKDEALRRAQVRAIRSGNHPVRWAAFQIYGHWK
jgi:CHAT domain-containing protein